MTIATKFGVPQQFALLACTAILVLAIGSGAALAAHSTCALMQSIPGGETTAEAAIFNHLKAQPPTTFSGKVKVGEVLNQPVKVNVSVTINDPQDVDLKCLKSNFTYKFGIKVKVSGKAGSATHQGTGRIGGALHRDPRPEPGDGVREQPAPRRFQLGGREQPRR